VTTVEKLPMPAGPYPLGRHVEHDPRSRAYAFTAPPPRRATTVIWPDAAPILNQGNLGGCVGWTGADVLNTGPFMQLRKAKHGGGFYDDASGRWFYGLATQKDEFDGTYPPDDTGSSGLGLAKALKSIGLISRYDHCFTWDQYLAAIATQPVCLGTLWTNSMFTPDDNGILRVGPLNDSTIAGGHEYMCRGRDAVHRMNLCRNHWGNSWNPRTIGVKQPGEFWLLDADLRTLLANQGDVTVLRAAAV